ncbi:hypothetical protein [Pyxidicoccus sp. MSG2]|uniref:hypothetical protein n=1 Tax=Pyxidicoccus sp. MSG2 TaxID=2996790 RepID=UPI002271D32F|nr:hypothetical protein [Pyxidicoccus sp. MSG2]MCY1018335.1 hypothetical protein [Pyxidicoccus sp. MSG2]
MGNTINGPQVPPSTSGDVARRAAEEAARRAAAEAARRAAEEAVRRAAEEAARKTGRPQDTFTSRRPQSRALDLGSEPAATTRSNIDPARVSMPEADGFSGDRARSAIRTAARDNAVIPQGANIAEANAIREEAANAALAKYDAYLAAQPADLPSDERARRAAVLTRADLISERAMAGVTDFSRNEYLILFEAVELRTGVPADILKAYTFGEAQARYYQDPYPRQFLEPEDQYRNLNGDGYPQLWTQVQGENGWPTIQVNGQQVPVNIGWDAGVKQGDRTTGDTLGLGLTQLTFPTVTIAASVDVYQNGQRIQGTAADPFPADANLTLQMPDIDIARAVQDPYYNLMVFANLTLYKAQQVYPNAMPSAEDAARGVGTQQTPFGPMLTSWPGLDAAQPDWALLVAFNKGWTEAQSRAFNNGTKTADQIYREIADNFLALINNPGSTNGLYPPARADQPPRDHSFISQSPDLYSAG